jgi:hypothetical protein
MTLPAFGLPILWVLFLLNCSVAQDTVVALYHMQRYNGQSYAYLKGGNDGSCISLKNVSGWFKVTSFEDGCQDSLKIHEPFHYFKVASNFPAKFVTKQRFTLLY